MFSRNSRYRKLTDVVTTDSKGRELKSTSLRLLPEASGDFLHTVAEIDRLDHLAYKYYKQSRKWWRICDANPEFMAPRALLGKELLVTDRFPLSFTDNGVQPPWSVLLSNLSESLGVEDVRIEDTIQLLPEEQTHNGKKVTIYIERFERSVMVTYNRMNINTQDVANMISASGFEVGQPENIGRIGKHLIIPPNTIA